jgi:hypothetical protein
MVSNFSDSYSEFSNDTPALFGGVNEEEEEEEEIAGRRQVTLVPLADGHANMMMHGATTSLLSEEEMKQMIALHFADRLSGSDSSIASDDSEDDATGHTKTFIKKATRVSFKNDENGEASSRSNSHLTQKEDEAVRMFLTSSSSFSSNAAQPPSASSRKGTTPGTLISYVDDGEDDEEEEEWFQEELRRQEQEIVAAMTEFEAR